MSLRERLHRFARWAQGTLPAVVIRRFIDNDALTLAASLSFFTLLSLAPLVSLLLWLSASLYPGAQQEFFHQLGVLLGSQVETAVRLVVENAEREPAQGAVAAVLSTLGLLLGASIVFAQLQFALNQLFTCDNAPPPSGLWRWLRKRLLSFGMVASLGFLLVISMVAQAALEALASRLPIIVPIGLALLSLLLYALIFAGMFRFLPDRRVGRRTALVGGAITAVLFLVGRGLIGFYLGRAALGSAYGPAGGLVVMLVWIYYCAVVFFIGALITAVINERVRGPAEFDPDPALQPAAEPDPEPASRGGEANSAPDAGVPL
jgi:membrane protein